MTRYGMAVDLAHCVGCQTCVVACQQEHALRPGVAWLAVDTLEQGRWPDADRFFLPHGCLHCDEPSCVQVCPTGASFQRDDGIVDVAYDRCIGCGVCLTACPYGARTVNANDAWHFGAGAPAPYEDADPARIGVAEKCTLCAERVDAGRRPACVEACPVGVRAFGDLDDAHGDLRVFAEAAGAQQLAGTGALYATGGRNLDVERTIAERFYRPSSAVKAQNEAARADVAEGNPAVVAGAAAAASALAAGAGMAAKKNRDRRARRRPGNEEPACSATR